MKPSREAREMLGLSARERINRWIERNWAWLSALMLLALYLLIAWFDRSDREAGLYQRIRTQQKQIDEQQHALAFTDPAYFIIEARSPKEAAQKLLAISTEADVQRIHAFNARDAQ